MQIFTYIYGPIYESSLDLIDRDILELSKKNGLWRSIIGLSDFILIDCPVLGARTGKNAIRFINNIKNRDYYVKFHDNEENIIVSPIPNQYQENDVDTIIHVMFKYIIRNCFEGMCNPPGGDWSGLSVIHNNKEYRWLSLPRVSKDGKRPDHVIEIFGLFDKPLLLSIESKEKGYDLERNVGVKLKKYIEYLFGFIPSVERDNGTENWIISSNTLDYNDFICASMGAFINNRNSEYDYEQLFNQSGCDILFSIEASENLDKWMILIKSQNNIGQTVVKYIIESIKNNKSSLNILCLKE